jgi:hypothetical protein
VLWPGLVKRFAQTSGTTAGDKFIPMTDEMMRSNYRASLDIFASLINRGVSLGRMTGGRCLFLGGSSDLTTDENGIITADLSGLVTPMIRWPISAIYSPGPEIALISDWPEQKIEAMAALTRDQDIRMISGMPSWASVLHEACARGDREADRPRCLAQPRGVRARGRAVRAVQAPHRRAGDRLGDGDIPNRHELYPASEGFIAMQDRPDDPAMRLLVDIDNFYEFVPLESVQRTGRSRRMHRRSRRGGRAGRAVLV